MLAVCVRACGVQMLLRVKACSVCKHLTGGEKSWPELRRWEELRWAKKEVRWVERRWEEVGRVEEVARGEKSWDELRRVKTRWAEVRVVGESWEEQGRGEKSWAEEGRDGTTLRTVEKSCNSWEELRWPEKSWEAVVTIVKGWGKMMTNSENRVAKLWGFAASPIGKPCFWTLYRYTS